MDAVDSSSESLYKCMQMEIMYGQCGRLSLVCINWSKHCSFISFVLEGLLCQHALKFDSTPHPFCFPV